MGKIILKKGKEKSLLRKHPWLFSGAIEKAEGISSSGETVDVHDSEGNWLARGAYSPHSQIRTRIWTFERNQKIDDGFFRQKIEDALKLRSKICRDSDCYRIINSESDGIPGFVLDRYGNYLVCQFLSAGSEQWKSSIIGELNRVFPDFSIYERSDTAARTKEGLPKREGLILGKEPPDSIIVQESGAKLTADLRKGHKTGLYLDQKENRMLASLFADGLDILNCFSYSGAFGIHALLLGAKRVTNVDTSAHFLNLSRENTRLNGIDESRTDHIKEDVFELLRRFVREEKKFDMIILDPPKFAESAAQVNKASRGYKDINMLAFKLLNKGGILFTFSCSGHVSPELFQKIVASAALDAGREAKILKYLYQSADHPVSLEFPEGLYLKGMMCLSS